MREKIIAQMQSTFSWDQKRINHALAVLEKAEQILATEPAASELVVQASAILHDIGIKTAEEKYNSSAARYQELEGPPVARNILENLKIQPDDINHICKIVANHHSAKNIDTIEFKIVYDADLLVNMQEDPDMKNFCRTAEKIEKTFKTTHGKQLAKKQLLERK